MQYRQNTVDTPPGVEATLLKTDQSGVKNVLETGNHGKSLRPPPEDRRINAETALQALGWLGVAIALPFFIWVPLAFISPIPSMIDIFGVVGLRIPASITIAGLLMAAIGFHKS